MNDKTNPSYYKATKGFEVIDVIEEFTRGLDGVEAFDTSNIIKYICRWHEKDGIHDLKKAKWYLEHLIDHASESQGERVKEAFERHNASQSYEILYSVRFETYQEAFQVLLNVTTIINTYGQLTVPDLQDLVWPTRIDCPYGYRNFGWKDTKGWDIKKMKDFWILMAPKPVELDREDAAKLKYLKLPYPSVKAASKVRDALYRYLTENDCLRVEDFTWIVYNVATSPVFPLKDKITNATAQFLGDKENAKLGWTNETFQITMSKVYGSEASVVLYLSLPRKLEEDE